MVYHRNLYLTYVHNDDPVQDVSALFVSKANRAARRDADLAKRREQRDRKVEERQDRAFLSTKGQ